jgi:hypothetical protein
MQSPASGKQELNEFRENTIYFLKLSFFSKHKMQKELDVNNVTNYIFFTFEKNFCQIVFVKSFFFKSIILGLMQNCGVSYFK